ncbi:MAG: DnaJ domain-containing protein [Armatimonadota bacterium]
MCAVALISFILAWRYPFFWLVFFWSLWVMAQQGAKTREHARIDPQTPRQEPPRQNTLYDLLEVSPNASPEVIKAAYRQLAMKYHPDRQPDAQARQRAEEQMKAINAAYEILSDPARRVEYDRRLREGLV